MCSVFRVPCSVFRVPCSVFRVPCSVLLIYCIGKYCLRDVTSFRWLIRFRIIVNFSSLKYVRYFPIVFFSFFFIVLYCVYRRFRPVGNVVLYFFFVLFWLSIYWLIS